jgi:serine/threonine protein kinase
MHGERWRQINEIFDLALTIDKSSRDTFLRDACAGDEGLRLELDRLLALQSNAKEFLEYPAIEIAAEELSESGHPAEDSLEPAEALIGQTIAHYRVVSVLGSGGMGFVYEAEDIRLGRRVALKFLRANLFGHPRAGQRFAREAHAASSLNHPNICTIYGVEEYDSRPVIVMELLEGRTLREIIGQAPVPLCELLDGGIQISDALQAAHAKGFVHRDVKPENIFVVDSGRVKVLDFGLAKAIATPVWEERSGAEPLGAEPLTFDGAIAGTTSYMSPEQARGEKLDGRSDLFSLGVVLYEMATARQPFAQRNPVLTIDSILNGCPAPPTSLNPALPPELDRILVRLLQKDREQRYPNAAAVAAELKLLQAARDGASPAPFRIGRNWQYIAAVCLAVLVVAAGAVLSLNRAQPLGSKDTIVVSEFENKTGDSLFDGTLRQALTVQLEESPFLSIVSEERIQRALSLMDRASDARLAPEIAREVCERTGSAAVVEGSIASFGKHYVIGIRARGCRAGNLLFQQQAEVTRKEEILNALSQIAARFRAGAGEPIATVEKYRTPLAEVTTTSLEALKVFSEARRVHTFTGGSAAQPLYERAILLDPHFAMAYASLGHLFGEIGESDLSAENTRKAWQFRDRATDAEKFFITASYELRVLGNAEKLQQTCETWARSYPRDPQSHGLMSGGVYPIEGNYEKAVEEARKAVTLDPEFALGHVLVADFNVALGRISEAQRVLQEAAANQLETPEFLESRYRIAFLKGDRAGMERELTRSRPNPSVEAAVSYQDSFALAYSGHLRLARIQTQRAFDLAEQTGHRERAALYAAGAAVREALFGNPAEAKRNAATALARSGDREVEYGAALALALTDRRSEAQDLAADLEKRFPEDTSVRFSYLPVIRARLALNSDDASRAIDLLQVNAPHELGLPRSAAHGLFGGLYPTYLRGDAWLRKGNGARAAHEYQKVIDHRTIVVDDPIGALANLQLGRALALSGETNRAKAAYDEFFALWKNADSDIPVLQKAQAEYVTLP